MKFPIYEKINFMFQTFPNHQPVWYLLGWVFGFTWNFWYWSSIGVLNWTSYPIHIYIYIHMHMRHAQNMAYDGIWVYGHPSHNGNPYNEYFNPINGLTSIAQYGKLTHVLTTTCVWSFWRKHNMDFKTSLKWENRWSFTIPADQLQYWL